MGKGHTQNTLVMRHRDAIFCANVQLYTCNVYYARNTDTYFVAPPI